MSKAFLLICFFFKTLTSLVFAQAGDSLLNIHEQTFYSLQSALTNPNQVYKLKLRNEKLTVFPEEIFLFKNLRELDLSKNKIREIPPEIVKLTRLELLDLSKNQIEAFIREICFLPELKVLRMSRNNLISIPSEIENLHALEVLDLWDNDLTGFPESLSKLEKLKVFDLRGILINSKEQKRIEEILPDTKIYFSPSCNCGF